VADNCDIIAGGPTKRTSISSLLFDVADDSTFGDGTERKDVANSQVGVLAGVDELTSVHALVGNEDLSSVLELVGVSELDLRERSATAGIVDDLLDYTTDVAMSLGEVELSELRRGLVQAGVGGCSLLASVASMQRVSLHTEDRAAALPLVPNNSTHCAVEPKKPLVLWKDGSSTAVVKVDLVAAAFFEVWELLARDHAKPRNTATAQPCPDFTSCSRIH
jgi:hypothetical protein